MISRCPSMCSIFHIHCWQLLDVQSHWRAECAPGIENGSQMKKVASQRRMIDQVISDGRASIWLACGREHDEYLIASHVTPDKDERVMTAGNQQQIYVQRINLA